MFQTGAFEYETFDFLVSSLKATELPLAFLYTLFQAFWQTEKKIVIVLHGERNLSKQLISHSSTSFVCCFAADHLCRLFISLLTR